jgi:hypothetical protein
MDDWSVSIAVEDKFVIFSLNKTDGLLPDDDVLYGLIASFGQVQGPYRPILDLGGVEAITSDIVSFVEQWAPYGASVIIDRADSGILDDWPTRLARPIPVDRRVWDSHKVSLAHFLEDSDVRLYGLGGEVRRTVREAGTAPPTVEEWTFARRHYPAANEVYGNYQSYRRHIAMQSVYDPAMSSVDRYIVGVRALRSQVRSFGRNSLMTQFALLPGTTSMSVVPYHGSALYEASARGNEEGVITARPSVLAKQTGAILSSELAELKALLGSKPSENDLQKFFEKHESFFNVLGYRKVYPKVVLHRDDGTWLEPDFMLEPFDGEFWDILDLKLPSASLVVGTRDRMAFSAEVLQLISQLREYGAYFEQDKYRQRIQQRYGITAYKPRLIGIIGEDYDVSDKMQLKRVMTQYTDTQLITFSQLQRIAAQRLLI